MDPKTLQLVGMKLQEKGLMLQRAALDPDAMPSWRDRDEILEDLRRLTETLDREFNPDSEEWPA